MRAWNGLPITVAGFRSTYALELLASVALSLHDDAQAGCRRHSRAHAGLEQAQEALADTESVRVAYEHLAAYGSFASDLLMVTRPTHR
ncbi:MAG: hypothetical protein IPL64_04370 [Flavobacteriales bacterium]|nr:hypothetical protein [Flavobacteriales bacterium]